METMVDYSDRLSEALKRSGLSVQELADGLGISYQAAKKALDGKTRAFTAANNQRAAKLLDVPSEWLATGEGPKMMADAANIAKSQIGERRIPLISYVQAGMWTQVSDPYSMGDADEFLLTDQDLSDSAFALEIKGDSMLPEFKPGDRVIIDPLIDPKPGDFVVAKNGQDEATFKKYRPRGVNERGEQVFELVPLNDDYPSMRSDITPIQIIGAMIEHRRYRKK